jgi:hypothetical protein
MKPVAPAPESGPIYLDDILLRRLLGESGNSNLRFAVKRIMDEADSDERSDAVSAFNAALIDT